MTGERQTQNTPTGSGQALLARLEVVAGFGFGELEVGDAVAEELLLGKLLGEDDLGGDEEGRLARCVGNGDFDEGAVVVALAAFEAQAAARHVLAGDDVVAALGMADASGVVDLDARVLAAIDARGGRGWLRSGRGFFWSGRRHGEDGGRRLSDRIASNAGGDGGGTGDELRSVTDIGGTRGGKVGGRGGSGWRGAGQWGVEGRLRSGRNGRRNEGGGGSRIVI